MPAGSRVASLAIALLACVHTVGPALAEVSEPVAGLWHISGRVRTTGCADRCVSSGQRIEQDLLVTGSGVTGAEGLLSQCGAGPTNADFADVLTLVPGRRGWLRIRILQRATLVGLLRRCTGYPSLRLGGFSGRVRVAPDGQSFDEIVRLSGSVAVSGRTATFSALGRVHAERTGDEAPSTAAARARRPGAFLAAVLPSP